MKGKKKEYYYKSVQMNQKRRGKGEIDEITVVIVASNLTTLHFF